MGKERIQSAYDYSETWGLVVEALQATSTEKHHWELEEYRKQGLLRATLVSEPDEESKALPVQAVRPKRTVILNISVFLSEWDKLVDESSNFQFFKKVSSVSIRIDEDIFPAYKRKEKPLPVIQQAISGIQSAVQARSGSF